MPEVALNNNSKENQAKYTVYIHRNKINNKVYIGQTSTSVETRWRDGNGYKGCTLFERAINKYGWDNFEHIVVACGLTKEESCQMEKDLIALYDATNSKRGYNISIGGDSGHAGVPMGDEARKKISEVNKGKLVSQETRDKRSKALKGRLLSDLAYQKAIEFHSVEVVQLTIDGKYVSCYSSFAEASRQTGINKDTISSCCSNKAKSAGGFLWMKKSDYDTNANSIICYNNEHLRPVVQLTKTGKYVAEFNSCKEAQIAIGKGKSNAINQCCNEGVKSAYGFIWVFKDKYDPEKDYTYRRDQYANQYAVIQLDMDENFVAEFNSVREANISTGVNYSCICECCNGTQKTAGGFLWRKKTLK